ncbi:MAG: hypothetical protein K0Q72_5412 [Armatimonadetes bacterium]|nr:hypothetical protein [Armatimonadota bacterium]
MDRKAPRALALALLVLTLFGLGAWDARAQVGASVAPVASKGLRRGRSAIQALGNYLPQVAAQHGQSAERLRNLLLRDPDLAVTSRRRPDCAPNRSRTKRRSVRWPLRSSSTAVPARSGRSSWTSMGTPPREPSGTALTTGACRLSPCRSTRMVPRLPSAPPSSPRFRRPGSVCRKTTRRSTST